MNSSVIKFVHRIGTYLRNGWLWWKAWPGSQLGSLTLVLAVIVAISAMISPQFLTPYNISIVLRSLAFIGIVSLAQGLLLLLGDIDASVGAISGLGAVIAAFFMVKFQVDPHISLLLGIIAGAVLGAFNGTLITTFRLTALVLTIGMLTAYNGLNLAITKGRTITGFSPVVTIYGQGSLFGIPIPALFLLGVFALVWFITKKTVFGRNMYAIGNSIEAAKMVGIRTQRVRIITYALSGGLAALAGILMSLRIASAQPSIGAIWLLPSIAGPVIGGIAITGGIGSVTGALIGGAIMGVIANIVVLGGVSLYWQQVINGTIVVVAIIFDSLSRRTRV
jgi:ribose transport system permease protein